MSPGLPTQFSTLLQGSGYSTINGATIAPQRVCNNGTTWDKCVVIRPTNNCGMQFYPASQACADISLQTQPDLMSSYTNDVCLSFLAPLAGPVAVTSGCGVWRCPPSVPGQPREVCAAKHATCPDGCEDAAQSISVSYSSMTCSLASKTSVALDAETFCPTNLVPYPNVTTTCTPSSSCGLACLSAESTLAYEMLHQLSVLTPLPCNGTNANGDSEDSWSACTAGKCGLGKQTRKTFCIDMTAPTFSKSTVRTTQCQGIANAPALTRDCSAFMCSRFEWQCAVMFDVDGLDDEDLTWHPCSESIVSLNNALCTRSCGTGIAHRAVRCAMVDKDEVVSYAYPSFTQSYNRENINTLPCSVMSPPPANSQKCSSSTGCNANPAWHCLTPDRAAQDHIEFETGTLCSDTVGFENTCPKDGCALGTGTTRRVVICVVNGQAAVDSKCSAVAKPAATAACPDLTSDCEARVIVNGSCTVNTTALTCYTNQTAQSPLAVTSAICVHKVTGVSVPSKLCTGGDSTKQLTASCVLPACPEDGATTMYSWSQVNVTSCPLYPTACRQSSYIKYTCLATLTGMSPVTVSPFLCASLPAPAASYTQCIYASPMQCQNGGQCVTRALGDAVGRQYSNAAGDCVCADDWFGANCANPFSVEFADFYHVSDVLSVWITFPMLITDADMTAFLASLETVPRWLTLTLKPVAPTDTITNVTLGRVKPSALSFYDQGERFVFNFTLPSTVKRTTEAYTLHVQYSTAVTYESDSFTLQAACKYDCGAHGLCNTDTQQCECKGDWSGALCSVPPCATIGCSVATASFCNVDANTQRATCICRTNGEGIPLFTGDNCRTPAEEAGCGEPSGTCQHEGFYSGIVSPDGDLACNDACTCPAMGVWGGAVCSACQRSCYNQAVANADCDKCVCEAGFTEESDCLCRFITLGLVGHMDKNTTSWITAASTVVTDALRANFKTWIATQSAAMATVMAMGTKITAARFVNLNATAKQFKFELDITSASACSTQWVAAPENVLGTVLFDNTTSTRPSFDITAHFTTLAAAAAGANMGGLYTAVNALKADLITGGNSLAGAGGDNSWLNIAAGMTVNDANAEDGDELPASFGTNDYTDANTGGDGSGTGGGGGNGDSGGGSGSNDDTTLIVAIVVPIGTAFLVALCIFIAYVMRCLCFARSNKVAVDSSASSTDNGVPVHGQTNAANGAPATTRGGM